MAEQLLPNVLIFISGRDDVEDNNKYIPITSINTLRETRRDHPSSVFCGPFLTAVACQTYELDLSRRKSTKFRKEKCLRIPYSFCRHFMAGGICAWDKK